MKVTEDSISMSLKIEMSKDEAKEGLLLSIMKNSTGHTFLPYEIISSKGIKLDEVITLELEYIPRWSKI